MNVGAGRNRGSGLRDFGFTLWIAGAVLGALVWPQAFLHWGPVDLRNRWIFLGAIQAVMFAMGVQMSLADFAGVARAPRGVAVGLVCHYTIMPLVGLGLALLFRFPPEIAAGLVLVGSCSSGLASNVMAYIARSDLALSVTVTALSTCLAPLCTPLLVHRLAGTMVHIDRMEVAEEIIRMVLVPIGGALLHDGLRRANPAPARWIAAALAVAAAALLALRHWQAGGFLAEGLALGIGYHALWRLWPAIDRRMPLLAMIGIVYATSVTVAAGRDQLLRIGGWLILAEALHNGAGYGLGYALARGCGLRRNAARSVAFEVGMQNGGMAAGLASAMGKLSTLGLAAAIFSPIMNVSGSLLANYWKRRPV